MNPMNTNAQNTEHGEKLMNSPTLSLKEIAGTIMAELEKNENVKEVVVHVRVIRLPKGGKKGKKSCKAQVSTVSYKFDINQAIFHKILARRRQRSIPPKIPILLERLHLYRVLRLAYNY